MNYEKIIVELLSRIQVLEEKVELLMSGRDDAEYSKRNPKSSGAAKVSTKDIRDYIESRKSEAKSAGEEYIVLRASDIHRINRLKNAMPLVCNAMRQCMREGDIVLHQTPSGYSSSLEIKYFV